MQTLAQTATLTVSHGPDRGAVFRLSDEMAQIGRGPDRHVALNDPELSDLHASIACRNGRYALYALTDSVEVDDNPIPAERWVWLPEQSHIRLSKRTVLHFTSSAPPPPADAIERENENSTPRPSAQVNRRGSRSTRAGRPQRSGGRKSANVARFITDQQGDTLVKLGEDGHLPELTLSEASQRRSVEQPKSGTNPVLVYGAVAFSFVLSAAMLLIDAEPSNVSQREVATARRLVTDFYGRPGDSLKPYQRLLREAQLARARGDYAAEERAYRRVLAMLNSEDYNRTRGPERLASLTGDPKSDARLRELISTLLRR